MSTTGTTDGQELISSVGEHGQSCTCCVCSIKECSLCIVSAPLSFTVSLIRVIPGAPPVGVHYCWILGISRALAQLSFGPGRRTMWALGWQERHSGSRGFWSRLLQGAELSLSHTLGSPLPLYQTLLTDFQTFHLCHCTSLLREGGRRGPAAKTPFYHSSLCLQPFLRESSSPHIPGALCTGKTGLLKSSDSCGSLPI